MTKHHFRTIHDSVSHWYIIFLAGAVFIGAGILILIRPEEMLVALATLLGVGLALVGLIEIAFALANQKQMVNWGWPLALGLVTSIIGAVFLTHPDFTLIVMTLTLGFMVLFRSVAAVMYSLDLKHYGARDWWILAGVASLGILLSFLILIYETFSIGSVAALAGFALLVAGTYNILLSLRLRRLKGISSRLSEVLKTKYYQIQREIEEELRHSTDHF